MCILLAAAWKEVDQDDLAQCEADPAAGFSSPSTFRTPMSPLVNCFAHCRCRSGVGRASVTTHPVSRKTAPSLSADIPSSMGSSGWVDGVAPVVVVVVVVSYGQRVAYAPSFLAG